MPSQTPTEEQNNIDSRRNPYEMRFDLLHLAKDILQHNIHLKLEQAKSSSDTDVSKCQFTYTAEEVIAEAKKLNQFVSNKTIPVP